MQYLRWNRPLLWLRVSPLLLCVVHWECDFAFASLLAKLGCWNRSNVTETSLDPTPRFMKPSTSTRPNAWLLCSHRQKGCRDMKRLWYDMFATNGDAHGMLLNPQEHIWPVGASCFAFLGRACWASNFHFSRVQKVTLETAVWPGGTGETFGCFARFLKVQHCFRQLGAVSRFARFPKAT